MSNTLLTYKLN